MLLIHFLSEALAAIERYIERAQQHSGDAFLGSASDHVDLERRLAAVARPPAWIPHYG